MAATKRSWPLLLVAACSFIPVLGFFIGAIAVSWGLLSDRPRARLATTLAAVGAFANLAGLLLVTFFFQRTPEAARLNREATRRDLARVVAALESYRERTGAYPTSLAALERPFAIPPVNIHDQGAGIIRIYRVYEYHLAADGGSYDLFSVGPDGRPGTDDDIRPALTDSVVARSGYRPPPTRSFDLESPAPEPR
jgi:hypothetical protein